MYLFSPKLTSHPGCHITLSRVPLAIQWIVPPHLKQAATSPFPESHTLFCSETFSVIQDWWLSRSAVSESCDPMDCGLPGFSVLGDSPDKNARVGCHALIQGILPTQGSNPSLKPSPPALQVISLLLSHQESPD